MSYPALLDGFYVIVFNPFPTRVPFNILFGPNDLTFLIQKNKLLRQITFTFNSITIRLYNIIHFDLEV